MKTIRLLALIGFLPLLAQAQTQFIATTSTNDPTRIKVTRIAVTNNVIVTPQSVTSGAVNGTNAGPGTVGQVVKLNSSGLVDSTLLPSQSSASLLTTNLARFSVATGDASQWVLIGTLTTTKSGIVHAVARAQLVAPNGYANLGIGIGPIANTGVVASTSRDMTPASATPGFNISYSGLLSSNTIVSMWGSASANPVTFTNANVGGVSPYATNALGLSVLQLGQ